MSLIGKLKSLFQIKQDSYDVLFYASHNVDELWIRSTALQCKSSDLKVMMVCGNEVPENVKDIYKSAGIDLRENCFGKDLKSIHAKLAVTASSGLRKNIFHKSLLSFVHMPHSISSLHMIYPEDAFDGYDYLFSVGLHHDLEMETIATRRKLLNFKGTLPTGYGKIDILKERKAKHSASPKDRPVILIAPSWGQRNILNTMGTTLCLRLLEDGYNVVVRPHPMFFIENDPFLAEVDKNLSYRAGFSLETSTDVGTAIFDADILITDYSGIAQEFSSISLRPVIFINVAKKILNPAWEEYGLPPIELRSRGVLGPIVSPNTDETLATIKNVLSDAKIWSDNAKTFKTEYLHTDDCSATAVGHIRKLLSEAHKNG